MRKYNRKEFIRGITLPTTALLLSKIVPSVSASEINIFEDSQYVDKTYVEKVFANISEQSIQTLTLGELQYAATLATTDVEANKILNAILQNDVAEVYSSSSSYIDTYLAVTVYPASRIVKYIGQGVSVGLTMLDILDSVNISLGPPSPTLGQYYKVDSWIEDNRLHSHVTVWQSKAAFDNGDIPIYSGGSSVSTEIPRF